MDRVAQKEIIKILFILKEYNNASAQNSICIKGITDCLKDDFSIDYLSYEYNDSHQADGVFSFTVRENSFIRKLCKIFTYPIDKKIENGFYSILCKLLEKNKYDAVVAVENPIEAVTATYRAKRKFDFKYIIYEIDPASNRFKNPKSLFKKICIYRARKIEMRVFSSADYIFHMKSHKEHFLRFLKNRFADKTDFLDIPAISRDYWSKNEPSFTRPKFIYCGSFYKKLREPERAFDLMSSILGLIDGIFVVYTHGKYLKMIRKRYANNKSIIANDFIPNSEIKKELDSSDVLISVGNFNSDFLPSKTIQYISTGKPVIHFYNDNNDSSIRYFEIYHNALLIDLSDTIETNTNKIIKFLSEPAISCNYEDIFHKFYENTFEYSSEKIKKAIID